MTPTQALSLAALATLILYVVPGGRVLGRPLLLLATLAHELGHGLTAMLAGGSFKRLALWGSGAGVAMHQGNYSRLGRAAVAAGGPLGPPLFALLLFWAAREAHSAHLALAILGAVLLLVAVVWVRNLFGVLFVLALAGAVGALAWFADDVAAQIACAFLAIQMALSVFSRADYLFRASARTNAGVLPSDTAQIAAALWLPHWFWGGLIALASLAVLAFGLWLFAQSA